MNIDEVFLKELYGDFNKKSGALATYIQKLGEDNSEIKDRTIEIVKLLQEKYKILSDYRDTRKKVNPASNFSLNSQYSNESIDMVDNSIQEINAKIEQMKKAINFKFSKIKEELGAVTALFNKEADIVNNIHDTWVDIIESKE